MTKQVFSLILSCVALLALCAAGQAEVADDYLAQIAGSYVELFPEMSKEEYRDDWIEAVSPLVGAENAEAARELLIGMCIAEPYGAEAIALYADDPDSMRFNCSFLGGVARFTVEGSSISGVDAQGSEVFRHSYTRMDVENENGFLFYQSDDADAGQFRYFAFSPDTMATTWHLEFRYSEDLEDLYSWFDGTYAYWNASAIAAGYTDDEMRSAIQLFASENLSGGE